MPHPVLRYVRGALVALSLLMALPTSSIARPLPALPAPHLGYGISVRDPSHIGALFAPLGFEWIKQYEMANAMPTQRLPYHVMYRIEINQGDRWSWPAGRPNFAKIYADVRQIAQNGLGLVDAYEIGNEPNMNWQWMSQPVDPADYVEALRQAFTAIKEVDPDAIVVSGGLGPVGRIKGTCTGNSGNTYTNNNCGAMDEREYARQMFSRGAGAYFDAFGYHPTGFAYPPEQALDQLPPDDNGNGFAFRSAEVIHAILEEYNLGNKPIWATEFGWMRDPSEDPSYKDHTPVGCHNDSDWQKVYGWYAVPEVQQASYLTRAVEYADVNWPWMGVMFVWNLDWQNQGWLCESSRYFSVRQDDNTDAGIPALAYTALLNMPRRSAWTGPSMEVTPDALTFVGAQDEPRTITQTVSIEHGGTMPFTWTASLQAPAPPGLVISPISGTAPNTLTVSADASLFAITGTFLYTLHLTADPTTTLGSPFTLPLTLRVVDHWQRAYLPVIARDYAAPTPTPPPPTPISTTTRFGAVFITSAEAPADEARFQRAQDTGAGVDRWPLYWTNVERSEGQFVWSYLPYYDEDRAVIGDVEHGLQPLLILMNTPSFYATAGNQFVQPLRVGQPLLPPGVYGPQDISSISSAGSAPRGLDNPVFTDGDTPGAGKQINPNNPWARFVYEAVNRYKPGGVLAQQKGWAADQGVRHWEIWNEEDYTGFWIGTPTQYARLLKVAYLAARHADPQAKIIFGGLANIDPNSTWLRQTLDVINAYPDKDANNWFFDSVAEHNYVRAWNTFNYLYRAWSTLNTYSITNKSLWVTESNVWSCGDGPITPPCFHEDGSPVELRANLDEQAAFVVQSATYATWINILMPVDVYFHFQMYDDCNDPIAGTTWGGGLGLVRNPTNWGCFPTWLPNTPRPAYSAFQSVTRYLSDVTPKWRRRPTPNLELFSFYHPSTQERVLAMWARSYVTETAVITATSTSAQLAWYGGTQTITPSNGVYTVTLPAATNNAFNDLSAPIGGRPYFLIEPDPSGTGGP